MITSSFKKRVFAWVFIPLAFINAAAAVPQKTRQQETLVSAGLTLYNHAFPGKLLFVDNQGTVEITTLGKAVLCFAKAPMRGTPVEAGVIDNIGLLSIIATKMTEHMKLDLGKATYAYESLALKPASAIAHKQASIQTLNTGLFTSLQKTLVHMAASEEGFLNVLNTFNQLADPNIEIVREVISPFLGLIVPAASMNYYVGAIQNGHPQWPQAQDITLELNQLKMAVVPFIPLFAKQYLFGTRNPTSLAKNINALGKKFQENLKRFPARYTAFLHLRDVIDLAAIGGAYVGTRSFIQGLVPILASINDKWGQPYFTSAGLANYAPSACGSIAALLLTYFLIQEVKERYVALKGGRDALVPVTHFIRGAHELYQTLKCHNELYQRLPSHIICGFNTFFGPQADSELAEMVELAFSLTFDTTDGTMFVVGRYARFLQLVRQHVDALKELGCLAGYIDYLTTLATYMNTPAVTNERGQTIAFSYATFVEDDKPYLMAQDLWFPAYDRTKVVATSVSLGNGDPAQHLLITGVNGCGKSIVMSAMMSLVVMAHTHGIVAARENALTPFDYVIFHGNIADEKGAGLSKGVKEMVCCADIIKKVRDAGNGDVADLADNVAGIAEVIERTRGLKGKIYLTFDELFSATDPVSAERLSSVVIRALIKNPNLMMVATTHNRGLTKLSATTNGLIRNAFIETNFNDKTGAVDYRRQLVPGVNNSMPALFIMKDKLKENGIHDDDVMVLIDMALEEQRQDGGFTASA